MVTAAACPRLFEYPPLRDSEHYVETTLFGHYLRASQKNTRKARRLNAIRTFSCIVKNTTEDGKDMLCESSVVCLHSSHNVSTPFETILPPSPKKKKRSKGSSLSTCDQQVIMGCQEHNVLSSMWCLLGGARNEMSRQCRFQKHKFCVLAITGVTNLRKCPRKF